MTHLFTSFRLPVIIVSFLCFFFFQLDLHAQNISGSWSGTLHLPGMELTLVFHLDKTGDDWTATMDSPDQNATDIPASSVIYEAPELYIEIQNGLIRYEGAWKKEDDSIEGTFKQSGMSFPLVLKRGAPTTEQNARPQTPEPPYPYESKEVNFSNPKANHISLAGTLTLPPGNAPFPAVILITGSGPQDRDETLFDHKPFLVISDYLTRHGIAVLRFDDRGTAESEGDFTTATTADFATDVEAAVAFLKTTKEIDPARIGLIGHSEGGIIAPMVAASDPDLAFIVLLAGPGYPGAEILLMQNEALGRASGISEDQLNKSEKINEKIYKIITSEDPDSAAIQKMTDLITSALPEDLPEEAKKEQAKAQIDQMMSPWMHFFLKNDPADYLKNVRCPVLALNGDKDLQVPAQQNLNAIEKALLEAGNDQVTTRSYAGLNHLFQEAETGLPTEYGQIEMTFSPEVLEDITKWILKIL